MDISAYLIELLRLHDCVIIPDLGGFVTNYRPADIDLAGNSFNPPRKEIIFSAVLKKNDGLLVNYLSESEGIGYMEARLMVAEYVEEAQSKLENGETIQLSLIGSLKYDRNEKLIFEPDVKENLLLDAYGLEAFQFPRLKHPDFSIPKKHLKDKEAMRPVFSSGRVKTFAITIPVLLALLVIPVRKEPVNQLNPMHYQTSSTSPVTLNQAPVTSGKEQSGDHQLEIASINTLKSSEVSKTIGSSTDPKSAAVKPAEKKYHLIGGCFKMKENAEKLLSQLKEAGYQSTMNKAANGNFIIIIQSYSTREDAINALKGLRDKDPKAGYWMSVK